MTGPRTMKAIRLHAPGVDGLRQETIETPTLRAGEVLVEVHAAAITRHELEWPLDRLPHDSPYELSGVVAVTDDVAEVSVGDEVYALTPFDRDGVAAEYAAVAATLHASFAIAQPRESAAVPLPADAPSSAGFGSGLAQPRTARLGPVAGRWRGALVADDRDGRIRYGRAQRPYRSIHSRSRCRAAI